MKKIAKKTCKFHRGDLNLQLGPTYSSAKSEASDHRATWPLQNYYPLPFALFEPCGAVFIMNSKIQLRKNSLNEYFRAILHYFRVYSLWGFMTATQWTHSSLLLSLKFRLPFFLCKFFHGKDFQPLVESGTVFAARCYLPQKYFVIHQLTVHKRLEDE